MEIRHSNVLAWLLTPNGTHGIGGGFLRALVERLTHRYDDPSLRPLKPLPHWFRRRGQRRDQEGGLSRAPAYADITIGFKAQGVLLIIENKLVSEWYPDVRRADRGLYQRVFGKKYKSQYDKIPGVLLTTSDLTGRKGAERDTRGFMPSRWEGRR